MQGISQRNIRLTKTAHVQLAPRHTSFGRSGKLDRLILLDILIPAAIVIKHPIVHEVRIFDGDLARVAPAHDPSIMNPDHFLAEVHDARQIVRHKEKRGIGVDQFFHPPDALHRETNITNRQRLIHDQNVGIHLRLNRKG
ncbi:MAG: hypothetical protein BWY82_02626 [Verrucomicrobia bacterium ADurb.Bin474]|nr:MAG: hypothetical protein BWY82_02626 [Verrucomicrobia bacterium ADurb.Bin474]